MKKRAGQLFVAEPSGVVLPRAPSSRTSTPKRQKSRTLGGRLKLSPPRTEPPASRPARVSLICAGQHGPARTHTWPSAAQLVSQDSFASPRTGLQPSRAAFWCPGLVAPSISFARSVRGCDASAWTRKPFRRVAMSAHLGVLRKKGAQRSRLAPTLVQLSDSLTAATGRARSAYNRRLSWRRDRSLAPAAGHAQYDSRGGTRRNT